MAYDIAPLKTMEERSKINELGSQESWWYFYEHDLKVEISQIALNEKGQPEVLNPTLLSEVFI